MSTAPASSHLSPGFDFLQDLVKNAGATLPNIGQWIAPTLDPEEIAKRIEDLRTVQFWLEQNARMLAATIQALEVQRMTLSTLQSMHVQIDDLRKGLSIPAEGSRSAGGDAGSAADSAAGGAAPAGSVDPMQWWSALTRQFTELAAAAVKDGAKSAVADAAKAAPGNAGEPARARSDQTSKPAAAAAPQTSAPLRRRRGGPVK